MILPIVFLDFLDVALWGAFFGSDNFPKVIVTTTMTLPV